MLEEVIRLIDRNDVSSLSSFFEKGCYCEYSYLHRATRKGTLETFKLIEKYCTIARNYNPSNLVNNAIKHENMSVLRYLVEERGVTLKRGDLFSLLNVHSEEIFVYLKPFIEENLNTLLSKLQPIANYELKSWITRNFTINWDNVEFQNIYVSKYYHDNKLYQYSRIGCEDSCKFCLENKLELLWRLYRDGEGYVNWLPTSLIRDLEIKLLENI